MHGIYYAHAHVDDLYFDLDFENVSKACPLVFFLSFFPLLAITHLNNDVGAARGYTSISEHTDGSDAISTTL